MVVRNVYRTTVDGVEICIQQLDRVEEIIWLPYDAGLSAAKESHSYSRSLPALFEFLHVDVQSTGHTLSRPWWRQLNDVMSEIGSPQLHSKLSRRRHSTRQSHGLFALAKHLFSLWSLTTHDMGPTWTWVKAVTCIFPISVFSYWYCIFCHRVLLNKCSQSQTFIKCIISGYNMTFTKVLITLLLASK